MRMRAAFVLALVLNFTFGDEICENTDGDLFYIPNPSQTVYVPNPRSSPIGSLEKRLKVDNHEYTVQIAIPRGYGEKRATSLYSKEGFKSEDKIEIMNQTLLSDLVRRYGFKDLDLMMSLGYQNRTQNYPSNPIKSSKIYPDFCYHYQCDTSVTRNGPCDNLTPNTPSCKLVPSFFSTFIPVDGIKGIHYGKCVMQLTPVTGNIFNIWLKSALSQGLPDVTVLENYVILDWGEAASLFPEGKITYDLSLSNEERTISKRISTQTLAPQIIFTNLDLSSVGSSLLEVTQDLGWKFSFNMTVELDQTIPTEDKRKCVEYTRDQQTTEEKCTADENCEYNKTFGECSMKMTKKVNKTYKVPMFPGQRIPIKARKTSTC